MFLLPTVDRNIAIISSYRQPTFRRFCFATITDVGLLLLLARTVSKTISIGRRPYFGFLLDTGGEVKDFRPFEDVCTNERADTRYRFTLNPNASRLNRIVFVLTVSGRLERNHFVRGQ